MILHLILLPVNTFRLVQIQRLVRGLTHLQSTDLSIKHFLPFMTHRKFRTGDSAESKGKRADNLFYLVDGQVKVVEIDKTISSGLHVRRDRRVCS